MPISKHYVDIQTQACVFDPCALGRDLENAVPEAVFALALGSAKDGVVGAHSDLDLAFYLKGKPSLEVWKRTEAAVRRHLPDCRVDLGFLNRAEPIYRFEALKGRLLFTRDSEIWAGFFSLTCREYEQQMWDYERQRRYRLERKSVCI